MVMLLRESKGNYHYSADGEKAFLAEVARNAKKKIAKNTRQEDQSSPGLFFAIFFFALLAP
jgi:hypothetical protein